MRRAVILVPLLAACGRLGFDEGAMPRDGAPQLDDARDGIDAPADASIDAFIQRVAPPAGKAVQVKSGDYFTADAVCEALASSRALTLTAWVRPAGNQPNGNPSIGAFNGANGGGNLSLLQWTRTQYQYWDDNLDANGATYGPEEFASGAWTFVAWIIEADGTGRVEANGAVVETFLVTRMIPTNGRFSVGQEWDGGTASDFFAGDVDDLALYSTAHAHDALVLEQAHGPDLAAPDLVAYFPFDNDASDAGPHGYDGTLRGATLVTSP